MIKLFLLSALSAVALCDVAHVLEVHTTTEIPPPPKPYAFGYAAGRFPGHIDRTHSEVSDGSGVVRGSYSYVDPRFKIRTVEYVADAHGFHPVLNYSPPPLPVDSPVVAAAKNKHLIQYAAIANAHHSAPQVVALPAETVAVSNAKLRHFTLFQKIAEEHARIAAERAAEEAAAKAYGIPNHVEQY